MMWRRFLFGHDSDTGLGPGTQGSVFQGETDAAINAAAESLSLQAGVDYNHGSKVPNSEIKHPVNEVNRSDGLHRKPDKGNPNSVHTDYRGGDPYWERYYDGNGHPYLDIDYSDHHDPEYHSVPHYHRIITDENGKIIDRGDPINV